MGRNGSSCSSALILYRLIMVSFKSAYLTAFFTALASLSGTASVPLASTASLASRATPAAPHFVIYSDQWVSGENGPPNVTDVTVRFTIT